MEHTITEEVTGIDLVEAQLELAAGRTLADIGLGEAPPPRGFAIQARVNMESLSETGQVKPSGGCISVYEPPSGPGIRVDGYGYAGYVTSPSYDFLLAKVIARGVTFAEAAQRTGRALGEFRIGGVETNARFLRAVLAHPAVLAGKATTRFIEEDIKALLKSAAALPRRDFDDGRAAAAVAVEMVEGAVAVTAPLQATVTAIDVREGDLVRKGQPVAILEAMKMEHVVEALVGGRVVRISAKAGDVLLSEQPFLFIAPEEIGASEQASERGDRSRPYSSRPRRGLRPLAHHARRGAAGRDGLAPQGRPAHGAREHRRSRRSRQLRRVRRLWARQPARHGAPRNSS